MQVGERRLARSQFARRRLRGTFEGLHRVTLPRQIGRRSGDRLVLLVDGGFEFAGGANGRGCLGLDPLRLLQRLFRGQCRCRRRIDGRLLTLDLGLLGREFRRVAALGRTQAGQICIVRVELEGCLGPQQPLPGGLERGHVAGELLLLLGHAVRLRLKVGDTFQPRHGSRQLVDPHLLPACRFLGSGEVGAQLLLIYFAEDHDALQHLLCGGEFLGLPAQHLVHVPGDVGVDGCASDLFQDRRALVRLRVQEGRKVALRQQHRPGETLEVHPGDALHLLGGVAQLLAQRLACVHVGHLMLGRLQLSVGLAPGAVLAPHAAVAPLHRGELDFGEALAGLLGHDLVGALGHLSQPRRAAVQRQANRVEDGGLAGTGGADDGEDAVGGEVVGGQVHLPLADQRVEVLEPNLGDAHRRSPILPADRRRPSTPVPRRTCATARFAARLGYPGPPATAGTLRSVRVRPASRQHQRASAPGRRRWRP